jgi:hypothetical protein
MDHERPRPRGRSVAERGAEVRARRLAEGNHLRSHSGARSKMPASFSSKRTTVDQARGCARVRWASGGREVSQVRGRGLTTKLFLSAEGLQELTKRDQSGGLGGAR